MNSDPKPETGPADVSLHAAHEHLDAGNVDDARAVAQGVLREAESTGNQLGEARALAFLGLCDRLVSRLRRAHDTSQRAAQLFKVLGDAPGETDALSTLAYAASCLGRNEDAVEAAQLAIRLAETTDDLPKQALAYNYLGVSYFWSRRFDRARVALKQALALARRPGSTISALQPGLNLACAESFRIVTDRYFTGQLPSPKRLERYVRRSKAEMSRGETRCLQGGMLVTLNTMFALYAGLTKAWNGTPSDAHIDIDTAKSWADKYGTTCWLHALERWVRAEAAWAANDLAAAETLVGEMVHIAILVEHEQLACMGHQIRSQLFEAQGRRDDALAEVRALRRREQRIYAEGLENRDRTVGWQLEVRRSERTLQQLQTVSHGYARLALEDELTGIANRRRVEQRLAELLAEAKDKGHPLSVCFIDVNQFKQVNDSHSHQVGDAVLKHIAELLRACVRDDDLPARLGGDEFVVVYPRTSITLAEQVTERIRARIADFNWEALAPGLKVTVSAGVGHARPDDSVAAVLERGDLAMYERKRSSGSHFAGRTSTAA